MILPRYKQKDTVVSTLDTLYSFSISEWCQAGFLQTNEIFRLTLTRNLKMTGIVLVEPSIFNNKLMLTLLIYGHKCTKINLNLIQTNCNYGGVRYWFACPECHTKRTKLYLHENTLKCRQCVGRPYQSQNETKSDRLMRRARAARQKLGANNNLLYPLNGKPKGMHWKTYFKLADRAKLFI